MENGAINSKFCVKMYWGNTFETNVHAEQMSETMGGVCCSSPNRSSSGLVGRSPVA